jgi:uncharacterized protein (UPF0333 family)
MKTKYNRGDSCLEVLMVVILIVVVVSCVYKFVTITEEKSKVPNEQGSYVGVVISLSHKGVIPQFWEVQLMYGIESFMTFSVNDDAQALVDAIQKAADQQTKIKVNYERKQVEPKFQRSAYVIQSISPITTQEAVKPEQPEVKLIK